MAEPVKNKISFGETIAPERRKSDFGLVTVEPGTGRGPAVRLAVPLSWKRIPEDPARENAGLSALASFALSNDASATVFRAVIPYEVNLRDWLEYQCHRMEFSIREVAGGDNEYGQMVHANAAGAQGDHLRMVLTGDGPDVIWFIGRGAKEEAARQSETLGLMAASLSFVAHSGRKSRETLSVYADPGRAFRLLRPASWIVRTPAGQPPQKTAVDFHLEENGDDVALMRIVADTRHPHDEAGLRRMFEIAAGEVEKAGARIRTLEAIPPGSGGRERERWLGTCDLSGGRGQVALLFRQTPRSWLGATLVTPDKSLHPLAWMRGKRFYEIVTATLAPGD